MPSPYGRAQERHEHHASEDGKAGENEPNYIGDVIIAWTSDNSTSLHSDEAKDQP